MIIESDHKVQDHISHIQNSNHHNNLGHKIQNELISPLANTIKDAKYFSVILGCTLGVSHEKQLTSIMR